MKHYRNYANSKNNNKYKYQKINNIVITDSYQKIIFLMLI